MDVALRVFIRDVGDLLLQKVGVREIDAFLMKRKEKSTDYTVRFYYIALAAAFETAKRWSLIVENPFRKVPKPKVAEVQPVHFTKGEFSTLLSAIDDVEFRELCIVAVNTGMSAGELRSIHWTDVDFARKIINVRNSETFTTKSKKGRVMPMNQTVMNILSGRKERASSELVFSVEGRQYTSDEVSKTFKRYVLNCKVNAKLHFHSLRHTFATWLVQDGVSLYEVQKLLGHSSSKVTEIYSHLQPEQLHATVNRLELSLN